MANKIKLDYDYAVKEKAIFEYAEKIADINNKINKKIVNESEYLGFLDPSKNVLKKDYELILEKSKNLLLEEQIEYLVIIANKAILLQIQAIEDFVQTNNILGSKLKLIYVDESIDGDELAKITNALVSKPFAINVISKRGDNIETLLLFREFKIMLEKIIGKNNANKYIFITTNNNYGKMYELCQKNNYNHFALFDNITEKYLTYTPAILFPLACLGLNINKFIDESVEAHERFSESDLTRNVAYQYAAIREILKRNNFKVEFLNVFSKKTFKLGALLQMYLSETTNKKAKGLFVSVSNAASDIKALSQLMCENNLLTFNTNLILDNPKYDYKIQTSNVPEDSMLSVSGLTFNSINKLIQNTIIENSVIIYKIPNIKIHINDDTESGIAWILAFIQKATLMSAYLENTNPFSSEVLDIFNGNFIKKIKDILKKGN